MSDVFRKEYKALSAETVILLDKIKDQAQALYNTLHGCSESFDPRQMAVAKTNLEQAVMWAVKSLT